MSCCSSQGAPWSEVGWDGGDSGGHDEGGWYESRGGGVGNPDLVVSPGTPRRPRPWGSGTVPTLFDRGVGYDASLKNRKESIDGWGSTVHRVPFSTHPLGPRVPEIWDMVGVECQYQGMVPYPRC
eukprot:751754-Hanusia_phi.AAC.1